MFKYCLLLMLICGSHCLKAQPYTTWLNNDSIKFGTGTTMIQFLDSNKFTGGDYRVVLKLSKPRRDSLKQITNKEWLALLADNKTDWAANVCLYSLYEKDAITIGGVRSANEWKKYHYYKEDIDYWKALLK